MFPLPSRAIKNEEKEVIKLKNCIDTILENVKKKKRKEKSYCSLLLQKKKFNCLFINRYWDDLVINSLTDYSKKKIAIILKTKIT